MIPEFPNPDEIISGLPFIPSWSRRDWDSDTEKNSSLYGKPIQIEGDEKMKDIIERKKENNKGLREKNMKNSQKKFECSNLIKSKILSMKDENNENNCQNFDKEILEDCQTYKITYLCFADLLFHLLNEYEESYERKRQRRREREKLLPRETIFQMRQYDIYRIAKTWLPESVKSIESSELFSPSDIGIRVNTSIQIYFLYPDLSEVLTLIGIIDTSLCSSSSIDSFINFMKNQDSISKIVDENSSTIATVSTSVSTENLQNFQISQIWIFYLFTHLLQILHPLLLTFLIVFIQILMILHLRLRPPLLLLQTLTSTIYPILLFLQIH
ncbi:hypothetical protein C2G38_2153980 [Gigaspora rosea]|uniref:Uncharacterized protein n=1 Tax=Gigaspora rosea TaxID=44941 RepID=A0A397W5E2_9GLOM|nr:hypothetical protein C2G38_2153980 [Gigaspora rosea]